jgi:hypothetical protein
VESDLGRGMDTDWQPNAAVIAFLASPHQFELLAVDLFIHHFTSLIPPISSTDQIPHVHGSRMGFQESEIH